MVALRGMIFGSLILAASVVAADTTTEVLPQCAATCEQSALQQNTSTCSDSDMRCFCTDHLYQSTLEDCVVANCTVTESFTAKRLQSQQCNLPTHHGRPAADPALIIPLSLATILFVTRIFAKYMRISGSWGWDDYTIIVAYILAVTVFSMNVSMIHHGFGKDIWNITPFGEITEIMKIFYVYVLVYKIQISLAKISVCLFLLRIFQSTAFRYTAYIIIGLNSAIAVTWVLVDGLRCTPVHLAWTGWAKEEQGRCIDFIAATFANSFVNIIVDTIMVAMPVYEVIKLNLSARKKLGVGVMFAMGLVLTIVAILRVVVFWYNRWNKNPTVELQPINVWSVIECQIAVVCACLPAARAVLVRFFPGLMGGSVGESDARKATRPSASGTSGKISQTMTYTVEYSRRAQERASNSAVNLVELHREAV
ncbi:integral membrane protein [Aspergillus bombycis]|uniref:Integral membrane protein n=1 Tax=Aspergillus bombycis TaxID=109264 RepID=A0A1F8ADJ8_9EURO|nr:integral membrane protein [Aspergillus bombycis]OGM49810.1 integral membrane protein [Aspergillus bombycis]